MELILPKGYETKLSIRETENAIKAIKDKFERALAKNLNLTRVSAPLMVLPESGLNDNLSGVERTVRFGILNLGDREVEIVQSLAKWKRSVLPRYGFAEGEGLYTDMNAIRRDDELDNTHSIYVDQWDWEVVISKEQRTLETLTRTVNNIYAALKATEAYIISEYPVLEGYLPADVTFITSQELEDKYPRLTPKEREDEITKEYGAVFIIGIGGKLRSGERHDGRAPDYDDWTMNGDLLLWYPVLNKAIEITSMGVRVDEASLAAQLELADATDRAALPFHRDILNCRLPYTIGGGLGQSRICMYLLNKAHVGEVQASVWSAEMIQACKAYGVVLL